METNKQEIIEGQRYGRWTVLSLDENKRNNVKVWNCRCDCGNKGRIPKSALLRGTSKSCGCLKKELTSARILKPAVGKTFGKLTVLRRIENKGKDVCYLCRCECGAEREVISEQLFSRSVVSCGCTKTSLEVQKRKNGRESTAESNAYILFIDYQRNAKIRDKSFELTFEDFKGCTSMSCQYCGRPPSQKTRSTKHGEPYTYSGIDRIDNNKGYIRGNCMACCKQCNKAKGTQSWAEFTLWVNRVIKFQDSISVSAKQTS